MEEAQSDVAVQPPSLDLRNSSSGQPKVSKGRNIFFIHRGFPI